MRRKGAITNGLTGKRHNRPISLLQQNERDIADSVAVPCR